MQTVRPPSLLAMTRDFLDLARLDSWIAPHPTADTPRGDGHSVLILPGIGTNHLLMAPTRKYCQRLGYDAHHWNAGVNIGPTAETMRGLEAQLFSLNDKSGRRVSLIGKSMGGMIARELAKKHPDRVRRLIMICSPVSHPVANHLAPIMYPLARVIYPTAANSHEKLSKPATIPTTAFYTKSDGIVAWQNCLEAEGENTENIELEGAYHCTAAAHPVVVRILAERLSIPDTIPVQKRA